MSMTSKRARAIVTELNQAGGCTHPIRLKGETVNAATGELRFGTLKVPCKDRREAVCPSCSRLYGADAWILVATGLNGGKGVPEGVATHPRVFATVTAPSFGAVHTRGTSSGRCHARHVRERCGHGQPVWCGEFHDRDDEQLGAPLCESCFDDRGAVLWNAHASILWDRTMVRLRRQLAATQGITTTELGRVAQVHYLKVAELQRRGLVHFHALLRADGAEGAEREPPEWLTSQLPSSTMAAVVRTTQVRGIDDVPRRWGSQFDVADLCVLEGGDRRVAGYLAKYVTKTTDGSIAFARPFAHRLQIERLETSPHLRHLALTAWRLGGRKDLRALRLRAHAHTLGYRGQLMTKSRGYSTTFASLRGARVDFRAGLSREDPIEGTFGYEGRGYDDPDTARLAELFFEMEQDARREARRSKSS
jgi:uncharacterized Zn-finger protein